MPGNAENANPANGEEADIPGRNERDRPAAPGAPEHGASAFGSERANLSGNTAEPASEPGGAQCGGPSMTDDAPEQEKDAPVSNRDTASFPRQAHPGEDAGAEPPSTSPAQRDGSWFPSSGAESLQSAVQDCPASSPRLTGTGKGGSERRGHADNPAVGGDAETISPLELGHGPEAGGSSPELHKGGPRPENADAASPEDTALILGEEDKGLRKVSDVISQAVPGPGAADPRPLPPTPHVPGATIPEPHPDAAAGRRGTGATPLSASVPSDQREMGRHEEPGRSRWNISNGESEGASASTVGADVPAALRVPGRSRIPGRSDAANDTQWTQETQRPPSDNPLPGQHEDQSTGFIHTPIPTRPVQFNNMWSSPASNPPYPSTPPPRQQFHASSQGTATLTQSRFRAYKGAPPRQGRGFDFRRAPAPQLGTSARSHLFVAPQLLDSAERARIIEAYNKAFDATSDATKTLLSKRHRYPGHGRDAAALLRKIEFETATGESMNDEAYYALFDLETANDGMISALLEWMQGRTWIKVPFVNRIIHQVCRLMFTSAEEETRLRHRYQRDCHKLREEVGTAQENIALERMTNSWQRIDIALRAQRLFANANASGFRAPDDVERNCKHDAGVWELLSVRFITITGVRKDIEERISDWSHVSEGDLDELERIYRNLVRLNKEVSNYMSVRTEKAKDPELFHSDNKHLMNFAKHLNDDVNTEETVRERMTDHFLEAVDHRMQLRGRHIFMMDQGVEDLPKPLIRVIVSPEMEDGEETGPAPQDQVPAPSDDPEAKAPGDSGPAENPASSAAAGPSPSLQNPAHLTRPRGSCTGCQMLERELETKQKQIGECRRENLAQSDKLEKLEGIARAIDDKDMQAAFKHINVYQDIVRAELHQSLGFILPMLEIQSQHANDQADILEESLRSWEAGGSRENVVTELKPVGRSVKRLATTIRDIVSQMSGHLEKSDSDKEARMKLIKENDSQRRSLESLRKEMEDMEANATEAAKTIRQQMQKESDRLKEQILECESQLQGLREKLEERDADAPQTADSSIQELKDELKRKETELSELEAEKKALEEQLESTMEKIEALSKAKDERDKQVKQLQEHVKSLQIKLEAKAEAAKWEWGPRQHTGDVNFDNQHNDKITQMRMELLKELGKKNSKPYQSLKTDMHMLLPSAAQSVLLAKKPWAAKQAPDEDFQEYWRLSAFSRRRGQVIEALERKDLDGASEGLDSLHEWNMAMGPWKTDDQTVEIHRSINFLRSYANLEIGKVEGFGVASSEKLTAARTFFQSTASGTGGKLSWSSLKEYLASQLNRPDQKKAVCECEYKQRVCAMHKQCGGARYYNFMEAEDGDAQEAEIELTKEAYSSLQRHALTWEGERDG
ncbi:hypothetical protein LX36DRAFT_657187 [Colletotrichum falcatum]|nr:hypothetical protein LX36DRAFT_657187 [Colletotrichum falcatum]